MNNSGKKIILAFALSLALLPFAKVQAVGEAAVAAPTRTTPQWEILLNRAYQAPENSELRENLLLASGCYQTGVCSDPNNPWIIPGNDLAGNTALSRRLTNIQRKMSEQPWGLEGGTEDIRKAILARQAKLEAQTPGAINAGGQGAAIDASRESASKSDLQKLCEADQGMLGVSFSNNCLLYWIASILMNVLWLASWLLRGANSLFNLVIQYSVVNFSYYAENPGLKVAWGIARDLVNVSLLFVLLYAALGLVFETINIDSKKIVKNVILVALLINFSFFFTGAIIKASNTVSVFLYNKAGGQTASNTTPDITTKIFKGRIALSFGALPQAEPGQPQATTWGGIIGGFIGDFILIIITSIALLAATVMFAVRFIKLLLVMVLSPLAFLGLSIGGRMKGQAELWVSTLTSMCIFPIVFLIFLLMVSQMSGALGAAGSTVTGFNAWVGTLVVAIIINGMMVGGLMAANAFGATGGAWALSKLGGMRDKATDWARGAGDRARGAAAAPFRFAGRQAQDLARQGAGTLAERSQTSNSLGARALRLIPGFNRAAGQLGAQARGAIGARQGEINALNLSDDALRRRAAMVTTNRIDRTAITNILASRNALQPRNGVDQPMIEQAVRIQQNVQAGAAARPIQALAHQYTPAAPALGATPTPAETAAAAAAAAARASAIAGTPPPGTPPPPPGTPAPRPRPITAEGVGQLDLDYFDPALTPAATPAEINNHNNNRAIRTAMYENFGANHVQNLVTRNDDASVRFITNLHHDLIESHFLAPGIVDPNSVANLAAWLREPRTPANPNAIANPRLAVWAESTAGRQMLTSSGVGFI